MKGGALSFTISRENLQEGLSAIAPALAKQATLPILANILLQSTYLRQSLRPARSLTQHTGQPHGDTK